MDREHNHDFLLLDFQRGCISKFWYKQRLGRTVDMEKFHLSRDGIEDMRTISFKDHRCPFRPPTSGTFA